MTSRDELLTKMKRAQDDNGPDYQLAAMLDVVLAEGERHWYCEFWKMFGSQGGMCHKGRSSMDNPHDPVFIGCGYRVVLLASLGDTE